MSLQKFMDFAVFNDMSLVGTRKKLVSGGVIAQKRRNMSSVVSTRTARVVYGYRSV